MTNFPPSEEKDVDLLLVDSGDLHDGTGLSDGFPAGGVDAQEVCFHFINYTRFLSFAPVEQQVPSAVALRRDGHR